MRTVSSVGLERSGRVLLLAVTALAILVVGGLAWVSGPGSGAFVLLILVGIVTVVPAASTMAMRAEILRDEAGDVELRLRPLVRKRLPAESILSVEPTDRWTFAPGYGYKFLQDGARGLVTGGPTVTIVTAERTWVVTAEDQDAVVAALAAPRPRAPEDAARDEV